MGLASALNTALTGMTAAETTIDVVGNNLANSNTVGFKSSSVSFATQFLQTQSLGSSATETLGGLNPRQIGLGVMVASINVDFSQGTIQISSSSTDMAIQGEGFFIVRGNGSGYYYTRNGVFTMNSENKLTTSTGNLLLGYGVNTNYEIDGATGLVPITIPLGSKSVAQATRNVYLEGALTPTGDLATQGQIIETEQLTDGAYTRPVTTATHAAASTKPTMVGAPAVVGGTMSGTYTYRLVTVDPTTGTESMYSEQTVNVTGANNGVTFTTLGDPAATRRLYRCAAGATSYTLVQQFNGAVPPVPWNDTGSTTATTMNTTTISGEYTYYVTYYDSNGVESCPSDPVTITMATDGRIQLTGIPTDPTGEWNAGRRIYRNLATSEGQDEFYLVADIANATTTGLTYTDNLSDTDLKTKTPLDFYGPRIDKTTTLAVDALRLTTAGDYVSVFSEGTFSFTGNKGGRTLTTKTMEITDTTMLKDVLQFMSDAMGLVTPPGNDPDHPIPVDASGLNPGFNVNSDGQIQFISNAGTENAVSISSTGMQIIEPTGTVMVQLPFNTEQEALGESATTDMVVYDSLGESISVRLTAVLESRTSSATTYRWFADSPQNISTTSDSSIAVGTGLISFDGNGNFITATSREVNIYRNGESAANSPLSFRFDFSAISGLATNNSSLAVSSQDGCSTGTLSSFIIGADGVISGVFTNGTTRTLGQVVTARFSNPSGLVQEGENLYTEGVNSGEPVVGTPGEQGLGEIVAGAQELSNTDIGSNLVDLILASTQYRGNTRVVTTVQDMLDELLSLGR
jgi:flagellar hook protein FlgE